MKALNKRDENELKNLITTPAVKYRRPYDVYIEEYPHLASFMASVNGNDFLTDPTGSRRFLPFEMLSIDISTALKIDMDNVFSEILYLYDNDAAMSAHIERTIEPKNADKTRSHLNRELVPFPDGIHDFWMEHYPEIDTIPTKVAQMQKAGYIPVATFVLPENCWIEHFYAPQVKVQEDFLKKYAGNKAAENYIAYERYETGLYYKYKEFYGYVFYIGKKI